MTTLPTNKQSTELTETWGSEGTSSKDLVIPRIQLAQAVSDVCKEGVAKPGEIVHSQTQEILAKKGEKLEVLPIVCLGSWVVSKVVPGGQPEYLREEQLTPENDSENWKQDAFEDGQPIVKQKCLRFLVLLANKSDGFPFFVSFQRSNKNGGKLLSTIMQENKFQGRPGCSRVVELSSFIKTYKTNSWFVFGIKPTRDASQEEREACKKWYILFKDSRLKEADPVTDGDDGIS